MDDDLPDVSSEEDFYGTDAPQEPEQPKQSKQDAIFEPATALGDELAAAPEDEVVSVRGDEPAVTLESVIAPGDNEPAAAPRDDEPAAALEDELAAALQDQPALKDGVDHTISSTENADASQTSLHAKQHDKPEASDVIAVPPRDVPYTNGPAETEDAEPMQEDNDQDSSSEMDVSDASSQGSSPEADHAPEEPSHVGTKRKASDAEDTLNFLEQALEDSNKKPRLSTPTEGTIAREPSPAERLPTEYWQQVFLRLSPAMLSRCLRVNKAFNTYLTSIKGQPVVAKKDQRKVRVMDSETIWSEARKTFYPNMPRPLLDRSELWMLQLIGGRTCQFCQRKPVPSPANTPFNAGPGYDGLRVIWPFGIRTCGQCWETYALKDVQILVSPAASLRFGLPYAFQTPDLHFVPEVQRSLPGGIPSHLRVAKVYYKPDVDSIVEEYEEIKGYGEGTADEWKKGLLNRGKERMADAARWERWEQQLSQQRGGAPGVTYGAFGTDLAHVLREYDLPSFPRYVEGKSATATANVEVSSAPLPGQVMNGTHALPHPVHQVQMNGHGPPFQAPPQQFQPFPRPPRNPMEVEQARHARKADIERRCMELEPPLEPNVLQHIESFQAAMQITTSMNDAQWEVLKSRLVAQRETAELIEHQRATQLAALQAAIPSVVPDDTFLKDLRPAKEVYDREYEQAQEPLRKRLGEYADEVINGQWRAGQGLDRDSAPNFAVQVLMHVRKRYQEDKMADNLPPAPEKSTKGSASSKQGTPAPDPFLSLDNIKWVYDNRVRTLTDQHRRELFICAGCAEERKPKWFAFEGLMQHYGAKHTTAFSKGNIVVYWQTAEWPANGDVPFHTNPGQWVRLEGRRDGFKNRGHPAGRGTPQQQSGYVPPSPGIMLSENPLFSGASPQQQSPGSNGYFPGQTAPFGPQRDYSFQARAPAQPTVDVSFDAQVKKLSTDARDVWEKLDGVKDLLECMRMQTLIHHIVTRFAEHFHQRPNVDLLTDALATNALMRPLKNAHGLACKSCVAAQTDGSASYQSYYARVRNVKLYNASSLITHFKIVHFNQPAVGGMGLDWTKDMIEIPELQLISDLIRAPGMDDEKLALVAAAFPTAFPSPPPKIGLVKEAPPDVGPDSGLANRLLERLNKKPQQGKKKKGAHAANGTPRREGSADGLPEPGEDEYDPTRPAVASNKEPDMSKFDTDIARKAVANANAGHAPFNLTPDVLATLNSLTGLTGQPVANEPERSPSVGRAEPVSATAAGVGGAGGVPDVSAILATLTNHLQSTQTATPPDTVDNRVASAPRPPHTYHYPPAPEPAIAYRPESRRSSGRHQPEPAYQTSAEPSPARYNPQDLQAALAANAQRYQQSQQVPAYTEAPVYSQPQQASVAYTQAQRSPPRYRCVYEDDQQQQPVYAQPPQQQRPVYGAEAPVQYIQLPDQHHHAPPQYGYEPPRPKTVYVDEYGRPVQLIPIDSAPAPVQYAPHPYEQQQQRYAQPPIASYGQPPAPQYQPMYAPAPADGRQVYYEPASPAGPPGSGHYAPLAQQPRYAVYDDGARSSVPRN